MALVILVFVVFFMLGGLGLQYMLFFIGLPIIILGCCLLLMLNTIARAWDAGVPAILAVPFAVLPLAIVVPSMQFTGYWLTAATLACFVFIASLPTAADERRLRWGWMEIAAVACLLQLALVTVLAVLEYVAVMRKFTGMLALIRPHFYQALSYMPYAAMILIVLLVIISYRVQFGAPAMSNQR